MQTVHSAISQSEVRKFQRWWRCFTIYSYKWTTLQCNRRKVIIMNSTCKDPCLFGRSQHSTSHLFIFFHGNVMKASPFPRRPMNAITVSIKISTICIFYLPIDQPYSTFCVWDYENNLSFSSVLYHHHAHTWYIHPCSSVLIRLSRAWGQTCHL